MIIEAEIMQTMKGLGIMKPVYAEEIVTAIKFNKMIEWYILDKDYCFLDYTKLEEAKNN